MSLNPPSGNMYVWAWTYNPIGGRCLYGCIYCSTSLKIAPWLKRMGNPKYYGSPKLIESELKTRLVKPDDGKVIFVDAVGEMWGWWIPDDWIIMILEHCWNYPQNVYLFQSKNPARFLEFIDKLPKCILGTTIETNRLCDGISKAPDIRERASAMEKIPWDFRKMVSIEPILDFDLKTLVDMIKRIKPDFVSIGADSQNCGLPEPSPEKVRNLIKELKGFTEVRLKKNLDRLLEKKCEKENIGKGRGGEIYLDMVDAKWGIV